MIALLYIIFLIAGGLTMSLAWPPLDIFLGVFLGFVPLLFLEDHLSDPSVRWRKSKLFWAAFLLFAVWNFAGIWWVKNAAWVGVIASVTVNSLFFAGVFLLFSQTKKYLGAQIGYLAFIVFWLAWEYVEIIDWDLSWPWLTLGYALSNHTWMIQWYEYTGSLGGSLWILSMNLMFFHFFKSLFNPNKAYRIKRLLYIFYVFCPPVVLSLFLYYSHQEKGEQANFVVVQPNIDPYTEDFITKKGYPIRGMSSMDQINEMLKMADSKMDSSVDFVLFPETAVAGSAWKHMIDSLPAMDTIKNWIRRYPNGNMVMGFVYKENVEANENERVPADWHRKRSDGTYYKRYNSSFHLNQSDSMGLYHKSRLVIGVERIPSYFVFLQKYLTGFDDDRNADVYNPNHSIQKEREVFSSMDQKVHLAPIICYESVFGEFVGDYVLKGANVLGIITNDGWWDDSPGYKHHFAYARLRAIETRKSVARSANTGWSGFINQRGDIIQKSEYWKPEVLKQSLQLNPEITLYTKFGDWIGKLCLPFSILILLNLIIRRTKKKIRQ